MKTLIAWLTSHNRYTCACGAFKLSRADKCFDCSQPLAEVVELAERRTGRHAA